MYFGKKHVHRQDSSRMGRQAWVGWTERGRDERGRDELDVQDGRAYLRSRQERAQAGRLARSGSIY